MCDLGPQALSLPFPEKKSVWIAHSEFEERKSKRAKSPGKLACSLVFRERGAGVPGASGCCCLQPGTCTDSQGQPLAGAFAGAPQCGHPTGPLASPLRAEPRAPKPAWCWTRGRRARPAEAAEPAPRAVREPRSARPCCRLAAPPRSRAGSQGAEYQS